MPSGSYNQIFVKCPFYKYDDGKKRITCEGLVDNSSLALIYRTKADYESQLMEYCCKDYKDCVIHRLLLRKYEDEE